MITAHIAKICQESFNDDAIAVFDGGNTAIWANFYHKCTSKNFLLGTAKMGMLGAGVSQVLGAAATNINRQAYCIIGDGAMGFHVQEIETAVRNKLNVIYIVVCDKQWGMVKMSQQIAFKPLKTIIKKSLDEGETVNADLGEIKFDDLAKSMGAHGERVNNPNDFKETLKKCIALKRCCVIHVDVDPVKHMWAPSLMHFKKMHNEPKG
ncbi:MAG: thiamine pyrophosphate-dependent enzyme [Chitinophagales bacterium]